MNELIQDAQVMDNFYTDKAVLQHRKKKGNFIIPSTKLSLFWNENITKRACRKKTIKNRHR